VLLLLLLLLQAMSVAQKEYETQRHALFFKEESCKQLYKDHVDAITGDFGRFDFVTCTVMLTLTVIRGLFVKEESCKQLYKDHVDAITGEFGRLIMMV
jgi:hypothetical protein